MNGWPKNADGTTDWDAVFDAPENGLIPLIKQASTLDALRTIAGLVIDRLFTRKKDGPYRSAYSAALDTLLPLDGLEEGKDFDTALSEVVALFATIREERKRKAAEYIARKKAEEEAEESNATDDERRDEPTGHPDVVEFPDGDPVTEHEPEEPEQVSETDAVVVGRLFAEAFMRYYQVRLRAFRAGFDSSVFKGGKAPFILSEEFEGKFLKILNQHFLPLLIERNYGLMHRATETAPDKREAFFENVFTNKKQRQELWSRWQLVWDDVLMERNIPPKPEGKEEKGGLLGSLGKLAQQKQPSWKKNELTLPEWKEQVKEIKAHNRKLEKLWAELTEEGETYDPPEKPDMATLKELFGRSPEAIGNQRKAIRQIFEQGGNFAQAFDAYMRKTRAIDASLLATCYERPDIFFGKNAQLYTVMSGYDDSTRDKIFRLTWRYHGERAKRERRAIA